MERQPSVRWTVVLSVAGLLFAAFLLWKWRPGAAIVVGVVLAAIALRHWRVTREKAQPLGRFGSAVAPLALPIIVVGIAGAVAFPAYLQLPVVFLLSLLAWRGIVLPDWRGREAAPAGPGGIERPAREGSREGLSRPVWSGRIDAPVWLAGSLALALIVILAVALRPGDGPFEDRGGLIFLYATIPFWFAAAALRALGYAKTVIELLVAVAFMAVVFTTASAAGIIPWHRWLEAHLAWFNPLTTLAALAVLLAIAVVVPLSRRFVPDDLAGKLSGLGLLAACAASAFLAAAALYGAISSQVHTNERVTADVPVVQPTPADDITVPPSLNDRGLAAKYQPVLVLANGEQWRPTSYLDYAKDATLLQRDGTPELNPDGSPKRYGANLPTKCLGPDDEHCYKLVLRDQAGLACDSGDDPCAADVPPAPGQTGATAYFRVLRKKQEANYAFVGADNFRELVASRATVLIQYWFFYRFDEWKRPVLSGTLTQRHQGDWEAVMIGLADESTPSFVAYSEHCGGTWRRWNRIEVAPGEGSRVHPLIAVAKGSHANYVKTDDRRSPDWTSCGGSGVPKGFLSGLSYASNIRDETSAGEQIDLEEMTLVRAKLDRPPMSFPGEWGLNDRTTLENEFTHTLARGEAPATPTLQPLWKDPLGTVFCGKHWEPPSGESDAGCRLPVSSDG
jgi:hypothetical protein